MNNRPTEKEEETRRFSIQIDRIDAGGKGQTIIDHIRVREYSINN